MSTSQRPDRETIEILVAGPDGFTPLTTGDGAPVTIEVAEPLEEAARDANAEGANE